MTVMNDNNSTAGNEMREKINCTIGGLNALEKYVVTYTISNDTKRENFANALEDVGLDKFEDQSTHYGSYDETKVSDRLNKPMENVVDYVTEISKELDEDDVVSIFIGTKILKTKASIDYQDIKKKTTTIQKQ
jgi:hypothetical protein